MAENKIEITQHVSKNAVKTLVAEIYKIHF
jgi:hypothetical protein